MGIQGTCKLNNTSTIELGEFALTKTDVLTIYTNSYLALIPEYGRIIEMTEARNYKLSDLKIDTSQSKNSNFSHVLEVSSLETEIDLI